LLILIAWYIAKKSNKFTDCKKNDGCMGQGPILFSRFDNILTHFFQFFDNQ
jgi:hypothetical protein